MSRESVSSIDWEVRKSHGPLLTSFMIAFTTALVSGLGYYAVPHDLHWNASQAMLLMHFASGGLSLLLFIAFVLVHQGMAEGRSRYLLLPFGALARRAEEAPLFHRRRLLGYAMYWSVLAVELTGAAYMIPALLWYPGIIVMAGYDSYVTMNTIHLVATVAAVAALLLHVPLRASVRGRATA